MSDEDPRYPDADWTETDDPWVVPSWLEPVKDVPVPERPAPAEPATGGPHAGAREGAPAHYFFDDTALDPLPASAAPVGVGPGEAPTPAVGPRRPAPTARPGGRPRLDDGVERRRLTLLAGGAIVVVAVLAVLMQVVGGPEDTSRPLGAQSKTTTPPAPNVSGTSAVDEGAGPPPDVTAAVDDSGAPDPAGLVASSNGEPAVGAADPGPSGRTTSGRPAGAPPVVGGPALAPAPSGSPASNNPGESRSSTQVRTDGGPASARVQASGRSSQPPSGPTGGGGPAPAGPSGGGGGGGGGPAPAPSGSKSSNSTGASSSNTSSSPGTPASR